MLYFSRRFVRKNKIERYCIHRIVTQFIVQYNFEVTGILSPFLCLNWSTHEFHWLVSGKWFRYYVVFVGRPMCLQCCTKHCTVCGRTNNSNTKPLMNRNTNFFNKPFLIERNRSFYTVCCGWASIFKRFPCLADVTHFDTLYCAVRTLIERASPIFARTLAPF
jgi:hypothetical protein